MYLQEEFQIFKKCLLQNLFNSAKMGKKYIKLLLTEIDQTSEVLLEISNSEMANLPKRVKLLS